MMSLHRVGCVVLALGLVAGCAGNVRSYDSSKDALELREDEQRLWYAARLLDKELARQRVLLDDPPLRDYLQQLTESLYPEFKGAVRLHIVDSPELNAFALPNGSIYFNSGLIARMENEAQLATVIAHEVSHFKFRHSLRRRNSADAMILISAGIEVLSGVPMSGSLLLSGAMSGFSQDQEREADREGFRRLVAAGYDPTEAVRTFEILLDEVETLEISQPFFFSSHPRLQERIDSFESLAQGLEKSGKRRNTERFVAASANVRKALLERYLLLLRHKQLIKMLTEPAMRARYPVYADYYLGEAYRGRNEEGDLQRAEQAYLRAVKLAPEFAPSYRALGLMQMKRGEHSAAMRNLRTYLELAPAAQDRGYIEHYLDRLEKEKV